MSVSAEVPAALVCIDPAQVEEIWPHVSHLIRRAMARGRMGRFADVAADVRGANAYLWLGVDGNTIIAAAVTKVTQDDGGRLCTIVACGGHDWRKFGPLIAGLEAYARAEGCAAIEICGRPGWRRRLPDYRLAKVVIRKKL
jgi:hypothetical protein